MTDEPSYEELERERHRLVHARARLDRAPALVLERKRAPLEHLRGRLDRAPALVLERKRSSLEHAQGRLGTLSPRATLARGYAIVRSPDGVVTSPPAAGAHVDVEVAEGAFGATVD